MKIITNYLPNELQLFILSHLSSTEQLQSRRVCQLWNSLITQDSSWQVLAKALNERSLSTLDTSSNNSCLTTIKNFCERARLHIPQFYLFSKKEMLNNMGMAIKLMDLAPKIKYDPSKSRVDELTIDTDAKRQAASLSLKKQLEENLFNPDEMLIIVEWMSKIGIQIDPSQKDIVSYSLEKRLEKALGKKDTHQVSCLVELMSKVKIYPNLLHMDEALQNCPDSVPVLYNAMKKGSAEDFKYFESHRFFSFAKYCPQHVPLFLEGMKLGSQLPTHDMIYIAAGRCPEHIPAIIDAFKENCERIPKNKWLNSYVLEEINEKCPQYADLVKAAIAIKN